MTQVMRLQYTCQPGKVDGEQYVIRKQKRNRNFRPLRQVLVLNQISFEIYNSLCQKKAGKT